MPDVILRGGWVLAPEPIRDGAVLVRGDTIAEVGSFADLLARWPAAEIHGGPHDIVSPGFVNAHGHFSEGLITGIASDRTLWEWLHVLIRRVDPHLDADKAYLGTLLAGIQLLRSGVTTTNDMFVCRPGPEPVTPAVVDALDELGLRGVVSFGAGDRDGTPISRLFDEHEALREAAEASSLCSFRVGIGALGGQSDEMFLRSTQYALDGGHGAHIHVQEVREEVTATFERTGRTVVGHCACVGLFDAPTLAAHCVWVDRNDRRLLAEHGVGVAHNPIANMILASGVAPVIEMLDAGIDVGIGVDGPASNDSQDFLAAMKGAALLARVHHLQATAMSAREAWELGTIGGARALRMDGLIGSIEVGKRADLVVFDGSGPTLANIHDPYQALVFVAGTREVAEVWVDGQPSVLGGDVVRVDPVDVAARSRPHAVELARRAGLADLSVLAVAT